MTDAPHNEINNDSARSAGPAPRPLRDFSPTALIVLLGFQAMIVQIILIRESLIVFQGNELCFGVVFAAWLLGIAAGAGLGAHLARGNRKPGSSFVALARADFVALALILVMAVLPLAQVYLIRVQRLWLHVLPGELAPFSSLLWSSLLTISPFSTLVGLVFPFAWQLFKRAGADPSAAIGRLYVVEANGSVAGGIVFTFCIAGRLDAFTALTISGLTLALLVLAYTGEKDSDPAADSFLLASAYIICLLGSLLVGGVTLQKHHETQKARWDSFNDGLVYVMSKDSRYENLVLAHKGRQFSLYGNGQYMFSFPDESTYAEEAGRVLTEHPSPRKVLLIGGGVGGLLRQILLHGVAQLDYVELDPAVISLVRNFLSEEERQPLDDPRVRVFHEDGRYFVKHTPDKYDLIFINLPDPSTAMINRFYTQDFFREAKAILEPGGVLATRISSAIGYLGPEVGMYAASLDHTLRSVFKEVIASPGDVNHFFACDKPGIVTLDLDKLMARFKARHVQTKYFSEYVFFTLLQPEMVEELARQLAARKAVPINTDFRPVTYFYNLMLWDRFAGRQLTGFYRWVRGARLWWLALLVAAFLAARLAYVRLTPERADYHRRFNALFTIFCAGLAGLSWELVLIFTFQNVYGYVYERVGLIIAAFMIGLVIGGAWTSRREIESARTPPLLVKLTLAIVLYSCALPGILRLLAHIRMDVSWFDVTGTALMILTAIAGILTGAPFPLASRLHLAIGGEAGRAAGLVDSMDHLGAFVGALFTGVLLIPLLGITQRSLAIAFVNAAALGLLTISGTRTSTI